MECTFSVTTGQAGYESSSKGMVPEIPIFNRGDVGKCARFAI